jgi:hypothetical protein
MALLRQGPVQLDEVDKFGPQNLDVGMDLRDSLCQFFQAKFG